VAVFNRKPKNQAALPEVEQYYSAERRERAGLAWLLALVSIAVVALVIIGLFFGGRWVYRSITDDNKNVATQTSDDNTPTIDGGSTSDDSDKDIANNSDDTADDQPETPAPSTTPTTGSTDNSTSTATPSQPSNSDLPNTGPASVPALFIATAAIAGTGHYLYQKRQARR
jgi:cytoskeletal protein RodZ